MRTELEKKRLRLATLLEKSSIAYIKDKSYIGCMNIKKLILEIQKIDEQLNKI
jgi:hypothetical protein